MYGPLLWLVSGIFGVHSLDCSIKPFSLAWEDVTILSYPDRIGAHRSLAWQVGSQRQRLGMQLGTTLNATFIPDGNNVCKNDNSTNEPPGKDGCVFWRGGLFEPKSSKSWTKDTGVVAYNGSVPNDGWDYLNSDSYKNEDADPLTKFPRGWDDVFFGQMNIQGFPLTLVNDGNFPFGAGFVGLATDSVFLKAATAAKLSPSKAWSIDYGLTADKVSGEVVIGGYNSALAAPDTFKNYTIFPNKNTPCPLQVTVASIKWGQKDMMSGQKPFFACVEPAYWSMVMPLQVQRNFNQTMLKGNANTQFWRATWEYYFYNTTDPLPDGDITIELNGGFSVTIPKKEWIYDAVQINAGGRWDKIPGSIQTTLGTAGFADGVEPKIPFLGAPFLSQAYLVVDYENNVFSLANTNRNGAPSSNLVQLGCDGQNAVDKVDISQFKPKSKKKSNTGAIVGATVGGLIFLSLLGVAVFFLLRGRRQRAARRSPPALTLETSGARMSKEEEGAQAGAPYSPPHYTSPTFPPPMGEVFPDAAGGNGHSIHSGRNRVDSMGAYSIFPTHTRNPSELEGNIAELSTRPPSTVYPERDEAGFQIQRRAVGAVNGSDRNT